MTATGQDLMAADTIACSKRSTGTEGRQSKDRSKGQELDEWMCRALTPERQYRCWHLEPAFLVVGMDLARDGPARILDVADVCE